MENDFFEDRIIILTIETLDALQNFENHDGALDLYLFYYKTAKRQKTNQIYCTNAFVAKGLRWPESKVMKLKKILIGLELIENVIVRDKVTKKILGHYIKVNYIFSKDSNNKAKNHTNGFPECGSHQSMDKKHPNALSNNNINALSNKNKNTYCPSCDGDDILVDETNDNPQTSLTLQNNEFPANNNNAMSSNKVENSNIYKDVVDYLNKKADTNFKHTSKVTQTKIKARQNDGYALNDFYAVIDVKCSQWLNDKTMSKYLRPETLFGIHFESYLNEKRLDNTQQSKDQTELERLKETDPVEYEKRRPAF